MSGYEGDYRIDLPAGTLELFVAEGSRYYTYNALGEVETAKEHYADTGLTTYAYTYDEGGNILTETVNGTEVHTYTYDSVWKDKLISYDGKSITYDVFGCPTDYMGSAMTWDIYGGLTSVDNGTDTITYTYMGDGQRRSKTVNSVTTTYHYNNGMLLSETTGDETLRYYYDSTGKVASFVYQKGDEDEVSYFYTRNAQGDIIGVYRSKDSKLMGTYEYDLWGKPISVTATVDDTNNILEKNPYRYRGYYYDSETGFYYLTARYYDPQIRRFISADSMNALMIATTDVTCKNLFVYAENNPVTNKDSSGGFVETAFDVISLAGSIVEVCCNPTDPWAWAGVIGDAADLIPCVTGVGEAVKAMKTIANAAEAADTISDAVRVADKASDTAKAVIKSGSSSNNLLPLNLQFFADTAKRQTPDQKALLDLANESAKKAKIGNPISYDEAKILDEWAKEFNVPQHHSATVGSGEHFPGGNYMDHTHIFNVHVPYTYH